MTTRTSGTIATVQLGLGLLTCGCAATSVEATVTRSPALPVFKEQEVTLAPLEVTGSRRYETEFACGGKVEGDLGQIPEARRANYAAKIEGLLRSVLEENGVHVVAGGDAPTLRVAARISEIQVSSSERCDEAHAEEGVTCLPDPVIDGKSQCGCVAIKQGKLSPDGYDFILHTSGRVTVELAARLESADGGLVAEEPIHLAPPPAFNGGVVPCHFVHGQPDVIATCQNTVTSLGSGTSLENVVPNYDVAFDAAFDSATAQENGAKRLHEAMFPFEAHVRYAIYKVKKPNPIAKQAVAALKDQRYEDAVALFGQGLASVDDGSLPAVIRSRYMYDYGLALLGTGDLQGARKAIEDASAIQSDRRFAAVLAEIDRQAGDAGELSEESEQGRSVPSKEAHDAASTPIATDKASALESSPPASSSDPPPSGTCNYEKTGEDPAFLTRFGATVANGVITEAWYLETMPRALSQMSLAEPSAELEQGAAIELLMKEDADGSTSTFKVTREDSTLVVDVGGGVVLRAPCAWNN